MQSYIEPEIINYEDGAISFPVVFANQTLWISQKEISLLFEVDRIQLISMFKRVFRTIPKAMHVHAFFIQRKHGDGQKQMHSAVRSIQHYDLESIITLQKFYPHPNALEYIQTAQSFLKEECIRRESL